MSLLKGAQRAALVAATMLVAVTAAGAGAANAAVVKASTGVVRYQAAPGEVNAVDISRTDAGYLISNRPGPDRAAPPLTVVYGCTSVGPSQAICDGSRLRYIKARLGDGEDSISFTGLPIVEGDPHGRGIKTHVRGGDGDDLLIGTAGRDRLFGDAGMDLIVGDRGKDTLSGGRDNDLLFGGSLALGQAGSADSERDVLVCGSGDSDDGYGEALDFVSYSCENRRTG